MRTYLTRRLLLFIPTAFGVSVFIFVMLHTIPGDYAVALFLGDPEEQISASQEQIDAVRKQLGLDGSLPEQYARWLGDFIRGDLGDSWTNRLPVVQRMLPRIALSLELGILSVGQAWVLGGFDGHRSPHRGFWLDTLGAICSPLGGPGAKPQCTVAARPDRRVPGHCRNPADDAFFGPGGAA